MLSLPFPEATTRNQEVRHLRQSNLFVQWSLRCIFEEPKLSPAVLAKDLLRDLASPDTDVCFGSFFRRKKKNISSANESAACLRSVPQAWSSCQGSVNAVAPISPNQIHCKDPLVCPQSTSSSPVPHLRVSQPLKMAVEMVSLSHHPTRCPPFRENPIVDLLPPFPPLPPPSPPFPPPGSPAPHSAPMRFTSCAGIGKSAQSSATLPLRRGRGK